ncbi:MAG: transketolase [Bacteroidetes bacterium]|nr:transketolase [Bacteroidota bacterium]
MDYQETLARLAEADERIVVMTAENRAAIRDLPLRLGKRFVDVGISEATMIGAAAGLALRGRIPVTHALATFLTLRAFEFIRTDVGIANLPVKLVGGVPGILSEANGPTHQAIEDVALMRGIPNVCVFAPADELELVEGMQHIVEHPAPWYVRFNSCAAPVSHSPFQIGSAEQFGDGNDVAIVTYGYLLGEAMAAMRELEALGVNARVVNMRTLKPVDTELILHVAEETRLVVTLEDHFRTGGLYSIVCELLIANRLAAAVFPIAFEERWFTPALIGDVLEAEGLRGPQIATRVAGALEAESMTPAAGMFNGLRG